jgi:serine/threonine protein kinase
VITEGGWRVIAGQKLRHYVLETVIGRGGMGVVWRAWDEKAARAVAIKVLAGNLVESPEFQERFLAEANRQAKLSHPNIVPVLDSFTQDGASCLVMEYIDGRSLQDLLDQAHVLRPESAISIMRDVLAALDCGHQNGIIHRDVKPSNILLGRSRAYLIDFGVAVVVGETRYTRTGGLVGTAEYTSPEQILRPSTVDHRTDVYSAGVVLYEMLAGRLPFVAEGSEENSYYFLQQAHVHQMPRPVRTWNPAVPADLDGLVLWALEKDRNKRIPGCAVFRSRLEEVVLDPPKPVARKTRALSERLVPLHFSKRLKYAALAVIFCFALYLIITNVLYRPNLALTMLTAPTEGAISGTLAGIRVVVKNQGFAPSPPFQIGFSFSTITGASASRFYGRPCTRDVALPAGGVFSCMADISVPSVVLPETYYLTAMIKGPGQANRTRLADSGPIVLRAPAPHKPDVVISSFTAPTTGVIGAGFSGAAGIKNQGTADAGSIHLAVYFSSTPTVSNSSVRSTFSCTVERLAAGSDGHCSGNIDVPSTLAPGTYYLAAMLEGIGRENRSRLADSGPVVLTAAPAKRSDVVITSFKAPTSSVIGAALSGVASVKNQGTVDAGIVRLGVYFSSAPIVNRSSVLSTFSCTVEALAAGSNGNCSGKINVPSALAPGTYYLTAMVEGMAQANRSRLADSGPIVLRAPPPNRPDVVITLFTASTSSIIGTVVSATASVKNEGTADAGIVRLGVYFSSAPTVSSSSVLSGFSCTVDRLAAGSSGNCSGKIDVPSTLGPGTYYLTAMVDGAGQTNRTRLADSGPVVLRTPPPNRPDVIITSFTAPTTSVMGAALSGVAVLRNLGTADARSVRLGVYFSSTPTVSAPPRCLPRSHAGPRRWRRAVPPTAQARLVCHPFFPRGRTT